MKKTRRIIYRVPDNIYFIQQKMFRALGKSCRKLTLSMMKRAMWLASYHDKRLWNKLMVATITWLRRYGRC